MSYEIKLNAQDLREKLPTFIQAFVAFAEALQPLDLDSAQEFLTDPTSKAILLAAAEFKSSMDPILKRRHALH